MPNRALRLLRITISNRARSAVLAQVKKIRPAAIGGFRPIQNARLLHFGARAMTFNVEGLSVLAESEHMCTVIRQHIVARALSLSNIARPHTPGRRRSPTARWIWNPPNPKNTRGGAA